MKNLDDMNIEQYYLDLNKIKDLSSKSEREQIHRYYSDLLHFSNEGRDSMARSIFLTLLRAGYLIDNRDEKIETILS